MPTHSSFWPPFGANARPGEVLPLQPGFWRYNDPAFAGCIPSPRRSHPQRMIPAHPNSKAGASQFPRATGGISSTLGGSHAQIDQKLAILPLTFDNLAAKVA